MRSLKNLGRYMTVGACMLAFMITTSDSAFARSEYLKGFKGLYGTKQLKGQKLTCAVCHPTKKKAERNNYGATLAKALGAKKVKDADQIKAAVEKAGKEKSATEGKTFGELIEAGTLPGTKDVAK